MSLPTALPLHLPPVQFDVQPPVQLFEFHWPLRTISCATLRPMGARAVNFSATPRVSAPMRFCLASLLFVSCATTRVPLHHSVTRLPDGRFVGPIEVKTPPHRGNDFEVTVRLDTSCEPAFTLAFPDGEERPFGAKDTGWQALLTARAQVGVTAVATKPGPPPRPPQEPAAFAAPAAVPQPVEAQAPPRPPPPLSSAPPVTTLSVDATLDVPAPVTGHWERTVTERWSGQLEFEATRARVCQTRSTFIETYRTALDETGTVALWATVPQELAEAELTVDVVELVAPKRVPPKHPPTVAAKVEVRTPAPRPPQPLPRLELPKQSTVPGAQWRPGRWVWVEGRDAWVWSDGAWTEPTTTPAPRVEAPGTPPIEGCRWAAGRWLWVSTDGHWEWLQGSWSAPPPRAEEPGPSPDPTSRWQPGWWVSLNGSFRWQPGYWGRPSPRRETPPAPPRAGARWIEGEWLFITGRWVWSPGFYDTGQQPPPPQVETPPLSPGENAVWLPGFWRWEATSSTHVWVAGHWELPPGEDYVWVETPVGPGVHLRGHWELRR